VKTPLTRATGQQVELVEIVTAGDKLSIVVVGLAAGLVWGGRVPVGATRAELERLVGLFANTVALRADMIVCDVQVFERLAAESSRDSLRQALMARRE